MKKCLTLCLCLAALLCVIFITTPKANAASSGYYTYTVSNGQVAIIDVSTSISGNITIPSTLGGYPVTVIADYAFAYCGSLKSVTIGDSVITIGRDAFASCDSLNSVTIGNGVATIGARAFYDCTSLSSITIPNSVTTIGDYAFRDCTSLTGIWVDHDNRNYCSDDIGVLYNKDKTELICAPSKLMGNITIPDSVITITDYAFAQCDSLSGVTMGDSVTSIGNYAFYGCYSLKNIIIPDSVVTIGNSAFLYCTSIEYNFYGNGKYLGNDNNPYLYFADVSSDAIAQCVIHSDTRWIGTYAFEDCKSLQSITISHNVAAIGNSAFSNCTSLTSIIIPDSVSSIGSYAFRNCTNLASVSIGNGVTTVNGSAFYNCTSLQYNVYDNGKYLGNANNPYLYLADTVSETITRCAIHPSAKMFGYDVFKDCTSLTSITIPNSVTSIGDYAFSGCTSLNSITIPSSVTTIGERAFYKCTGLTGITIPDSMTTIGDYAFHECTSLTSVTIPDSVTTIGIGTFYYCTGLTSVTIPDSVVTIGNSAFSDCTKLKNVYYSGTLSQWLSISVGSGNGKLTNSTIHYGHVHDYTLFLPEMVASGCTSSGYIVYTCIYGETVKVGTAPLGHDYTGTEITVEATCVENGYIGTVCSRCGDIRKDTILDALGHSVVLVSVCEPTCENQGVSKAGSQCERCKTYFVEPVFIQALGHDYSEYIPNNDATYYADGTKTATCATCGETDTVVDEGTKLIPEGNMIMLQPEAVTANSGETVTFSIEAFGEIVSYQWQYRKVYKWFDTSLDGYNTNTLTLAATGARNGYDYRCTVTYADGTVLISDAAELLVNTTITVTKNPNDQTAVLGDKGQFTASAQGEGIKYQWQYCRPGSTKWIDTAMDGATKPTVYIETTKSRDGYRYRCKITDVTGKVVYTEPATLRVMTISGHPADQFTAPGKTVTFTVVTNVTGGVTYQWQYTKDGIKWSNTTMTGYNTATLSVAATLARNGYQYRCIITGSKNSKLESKAAALYVGNAVEFTTQPQDQTVIDTENAVLTVTATNAYAYCWQYRTNGNDWRNTSLTGCNTDTLTVPAMGKNGYQYRCVVTGLSGETYISDAVTLTVVEAPFLEVISDPSDRTVPAERVVRFAAVADGEVVSYCWQYTLDGGTWQDASFEGADTSILTVVATPDLSGAQFRCIITGQYGIQVITRSAKLTIQ